MTQHTTSISTSEGTATIDSKLFKGYNQEAHKILEDISELQKDFKEVVESASNGTNLKKPKIAAYFKAHFKEATKATKEQGELFSQLDEILA